MLQRLVTNILQFQSRMAILLGSYVHQRHIVQLVIGFNREWRFFWGATDYGLEVRDNLVVSIANGDSFGELRYVF